MGNYTKQDIIQLVEEKDVQFIRLQFTDVSGTLKNVAITASQLERALNVCLTALQSKVSSALRNLICICIRILTHLRFFRGVRSMERLPALCVMCIVRMGYLLRETADMS